MADISVEQKSGGQKTWIFAILAVVLILALMLWLAQQTRNLGPITAVEGDQPTATTGPGATEFTGEQVELSAVAQNPEGFTDRTVAMQNVPVAAALGPRAFWADIPGQNPFLMILGPNVAEVQMPVPGQELNVEGTLQPVTEQQINDWVTAGTVAEGSRDEAAFAEWYLLVSTARVAQ
jgi:HAMP domain-containing protein